MSDTRRNELVHVPPETLPEAFKQLGPSTAVTTGKLEIVLDQFELQDLDWNHMDQEHRPHLHNTYDRAVRLASGPDFAVSLTTVRFLRFPLLAVVTDVRLGTGSFYQMMSFFSLLFVCCHINHAREKASVTWRIVSHKWLKFLHNFLDRRLYNLNAVQNAADMPVRERRKALRLLGYRFKSDDPDFITANKSTCGTIPPVFEDKHRVRLADLPVGEGKKIACGPIELVVRREDEGRVTVWPAACPHEGGPLEPCAINGQRIRCPWHALEFGGATLGPDRRAVAIYGLEFALEDGCLTVASAVDSTNEASAPDAEVGIPVGTAR